MLKLLHREILRLLPGPFLGWLTMLMFLLLMQFLIKYLPDIVGRGLPFGVIVELVAYNLAYMLVLAVPMSVLIASLMAFGKLAETNGYLVAKSAGVSLPRLLWPALVASGVLAGAMGYFNNEVLPEANFRARNLWQDIRNKKPTFELEPGVFYDGLNGYSILVQAVPPEANTLHDVLIYDYTEGSRRQATIKARHGRLDPAAGNALDLVLFDGEVHRRPEADDGDRYERLQFDRLRLRLDLSDFAFERSEEDDGYRSDRTMRSAEMTYLVDSLEASSARRQARLLAAAVAVGQDSAWAPPADRSELPRPTSLPLLYPAGEPLMHGLDSLRRLAVYDQALRDARTLRAELDEASRSIRWERERADRYRVEIHKKNSIALACLIFMLIGAPLGVSLRRGGLGVAGALALGIFLFYWVTLVQGEKLADRQMLEPWFGMWIANIVMSVAAAYLVLYVTLDLRATPPLRRRLLFWKKPT